MGSSAGQKARPGAGKTSRVARREAPCIGNDARTQEMAAPLGAPPPSFGETERQYGVAGVAKNTGGAACEMNHL